MAESGSRDLMPAADWSRLEKEYERRQQEILLEAEAAVKAREEALNQVTLSTKKIFTVSGKIFVGAGAAAGGAGAAARAAGGLHHGQARPRPPGAARGVTRGPRLRDHVMCCATLSTNVYIGI